METNDERIA